MLDNRCNEVKLSRSNLCKDPYFLSVIFAEDIIWLQQHNRFYVYSCTEQPGFFSLANFLRKPLLHVLEKSVFARGHNHQACVGKQHCLSGPLPNKSQYQNTWVCLTSFFLNTHRLKPFWPPPNSTIQLCILSLQFNFSSHDTRWRKLSVKVNWSMLLWQVVWQALQPRRAEVMAAVSNDAQLWTRKEEQLSGRRYSLYIHSVAVVNGLPSYFIKAWICVQLCLFAPLSRLCNCLLICVQCRQLTTLNVCEYFATN